MHNRYTSTPPAWRGFSFALHLLRVQGFYFALLQYRPIQAFTAAFISSMQSYTDHAAKQRTGLYRDFSSYLPCFAAVVWRVHPAILYRLRRAGRCTAQHNRPIIIRYIRAHRLLWIHARRRNIPQTMPRPAACDLALGQPGTLHPAGQSSSRGRGGRRGTTGCSRSSSFRAFAR